MIFGCFGGLMASLAFVGEALGALGLPWAPKVTPRRFPGGSGGDLGSTLECLGGPWNGIFAEKAQLFFCIVFGRHLDQLLH